LEKLSTAKGKSGYIDFDNFIVESEARVGIPKIFEQLQKISELKLEDFIKLSETKFENTVRGMFSVIKNLESHLGEVLQMNNTLRIEAEDSKGEIEKLRGEKKELEQRISSFEKDIPLIADLEKRLALTIEEAEKLRGLYKLEKEKPEKKEKDLGMLNILIDKTKEERDDAYKEIVILENKIESMQKPGDEKGF